MREAIKKAILKMFPELAAGLHLDRFARVLAVNDPPTGGAGADRFRPRYAVDLEVLTADGQADTAFPTLEAVPLPLSIGGGNDSGLFSFPEPGCLVVVGFAYGRPDHPIVRQIYPMGLSLPEVSPGQLRWQQSGTVYQDADPDGNWKRVTDQDITDESLSRTIKAVEVLEEISREVRKIAENSTEQVGGVKTMKALGALKLLSGGIASLTAVGDIKMSTAGDLSQASAGSQKAVAAGFEFKGTAGPSLLPLISSYMQTVIDVLGVLATHTHPSVGVCTQGSQISNAATAVGTQKTNLASISA